MNSLTPLRRHNSRVKKFTGNKERIAQQKREIMVSGSHRAAEMLAPLLQRYGPDIRIDIGATSRPEGLKVSNTASPDDWAKLRKKRPTSKYGVHQDADGIRDRTYKGILYDSRLERDYAEYLDFCIDARQISSWKRQVGVKLLGHDGTLICRWYADFLVTHLDRKQKYHEVKGKETDVWIIKKKLYHACNTPETRIPLIVVTRPKNGAWVKTQSFPSRMS